MRAELEEKKKELHTPEDGRLGLAPVREFREPTLYSSQGELLLCYMRTVQRPRMGGKKKSARVNVPTVGNSLQVGVL